MCSDVLVSFRGTDYQYARHAQHSVLRLYARGNDCFRRNDESRTRVRTRHCHLMTGPASPIAPPLPGIVGTIVPDGPNKIFMGGLPQHMTEEQIKDLLGAFGQLRNFNQVKDPNTQVSKVWSIVACCGSDMLYRQKLDSIPNVWEEFVVGA